MEGIYSKSVLGRREIKNEQHLLIYKSRPIVFLYWWGTNYLPKESFMTNKLGNVKAYRDGKAFVFTEEADTRACLQLVHSTFAQCSHCCSASLSAELLFHHWVLLQEKPCSCQKLFWAVILQTCLCRQTQSQTCHIHREGRLMSMQNLNSLLLTQANQTILWSY